MAKRVIVVKTALMPRFYQDFHCVMGACKDNCCDDNWRIEFNKKDYLTVKRAVQEAGLEEEARCVRRLREREHDNMYAEFSMNAAGQCHLLREDGLCDLQMECGPEALPRVCRIFPRKEVYTAHAREFSLSPACEGVLALLWDLPEGVDFVEEPLHPNDVRYFHPKNEASAHFAPIRSLFIDVLQERSLKLSQRLLLLGLLTQQLQALDWEQAEPLEDWLERAVVTLHSPAVADQMGRMPRNRQLFLANGLHVLLAAFPRPGAFRDEMLEVINENWKEQDLRK